MASADMKQIYTFLFVNMLAAIATIISCPAAAGASSGDRTLLLDLSAGAGICLAPAALPRPWCLVSNLRVNLNSSKCATCCSQLEFWRHYERRLLPLH